MADSKELFMFRITFSPDLFRETKQKQKQITSKQQSLFFSCLSAFHFLRQNATILCGTFSQGWAAIQIDHSRKYHNIP